MTTMFQDPGTPPDPSAGKTFTVELRASPFGMRMVRADFNPLHHQGAGQVNLLCAAMITQMDDLRAAALKVPRPEKPLVDVVGQRAWEKAQDAARSASRAISLLEDAALHSVKAVTA